MNIKKVKNTVSEFKVEVVKIDDVIEHPNADRLTIVKIGGYNCISNKKEDGSWRYQKGDLVVYIPEAAVLPEWLLKKMGFWDENKQKGMLAGSKGNRVKAIKLRDVISQGILYPVMGSVKDKKGVDWVSVEQSPVFSPAQNDYILASHLVKKGDNVAELLNIIKYEPPIPVQMAGQVGNMFGYPMSYDIENLQKYPDVFEEGEQVIMTEKLHGTYCQVGIMSTMDKDDFTKAKENNDITTFNYCGNTISCYVTSKGLAGKGLVQKNTESNKDNLYIRVLNNVFFDDGERAKEIARQYLSVSKNFRLYIMGEIVGVGVQDLNYGFTEQQFRVFDVYIHDLDTDTKRFLNALELTNFCIKYGLSTPATLYVGPYSYDKAVKHRDGQTVTGNNLHIREGIVIRPVEEKEHIKLPLNRKQLKFISPDYLLRKNGTEHN